MDDIEIIEAPPLHQKLARTSWVCPIVMILITSFIGNVAGRIVLDLLALVLLMSGLTVGVVALTGIRRHGPKKILIPALVGIAINAFFVLTWITNFLASRQ